MSRKKRKSLIDELFGGSVLEDFDSLFEGFEKGKGRQSGYSISVSQNLRAQRSMLRLAKIQM